MPAKTVKKDEKAVKMKTTKSTKSTDGGKALVIVESPAKSKTIKKNSWFKLSNRSKLRTHSGFS